MKDCIRTTIIFSLANIIQFAIVIKLLTPSILCYSTCILSMLTGTTIIPCFIMIDHIFYLNMKMFYKCITILSLLCIPFFASLQTRIMLYHCFDENWYIWLFQGSTIPSIFWTTYKMLFSG